MLSLSPVEREGVQMAYCDKLRVVLPAAIFNGAMLSSRVCLVMTALIAVAIGVVPAPKE
jgi:hypothetical protein